MKQVYQLLLGLMALLITSCNSDQAATSVTESQPRDYRVYEQISAKYEQKQQALPSKITAGFWDWLKRVASVDAKAVAAYVVKHGTNSDWKEALVIGAAASASEAIGGNSKKGIQAAPNTLSYHRIIAKDMQHIKAAEFKANTMDSLGYYHYLLVHEVLQDTTLSAIPSSEISAVLYDKIHQQAQKIGINATYDKENALVFLDKIHSVGDREHEVNYAQLYPFEKTEDLNHFSSIAQRYAATFFHLHDKALFTAYSKEMEKAVLQDVMLSKHVKDVLLLAMATYRFGNAYYFSNF